jgi:hypothetical protein
MKGWRPSALAKGSNTGSGFLRGRNSAGHRIESPVFTRPVAALAERGRRGQRPRLQARSSHGYRLHGAGRPPVGHGRPTVCDRKTAPALHLLQRTLRTPEMKIMGTTDGGENGTPAQAVRMGASRPARASILHVEREFIRGGRPRRFYGPGGRRKSLKRLNSAKRIQENQRIFLRFIWLNFAGFGPGLAGFGFGLRSFGSGR